MREALTLTEEETLAMAIALREHVDVPARKSEPATKTLLLDFFGTSNSGKTTTTEGIERVFRRAKYNVLCPQETAEIPEIRNKSTDNPVVFQARHLTGVSDYVLNLSRDRNYHLAIISRGAIDMLYWYQKGLQTGVYSKQHVQNFRNYVFEILRMDLVDAYVFFTCTPEVALQREYEASPTKQRGSNMNEQVLAEAHELYRRVMADIKKNVPGLPIFTIDTSAMGSKEVAEDVLRQILPHLCARLKVPGVNYLPQNISLVRKHAMAAPCFEEQIKLRGHALGAARLISEGWQHLEDGVDEDIYLNPNPTMPVENYAFQEIVRIRKKSDGRTQFMFKSQAQDRIFSHRRPITFEMSPKDAEQIRLTYPTLTTMTKQRQRYRLDTHKPGGLFYTIHLDTIEGLGTFTEIRAVGNHSETHSAELLKIATDLGHTPGDIVEGSYLGLWLARQ